MQRCFNGAAARECKWSFVSMFLSFSASALPYYMLCCMFCESVLLCYVTCPCTRSGAGRVDRWRASPPKPRLASPEVPAPLRPWTRAPPPHSRWQELQARASPGPPRGRPPGPGPPSVASPLRTVPAPGPQHPRPPREGGGGRPIVSSPGRP